MRILNSDSGVSGDQRMISGVRFAEHSSDPLWIKVLRLKTFSEAFVTNVECKGWISIISDSRLPLSSNMSSGSISTGNLSELIGWKLSNLTIDEMKKFFIP